MRFYLDRIGIKSEDTPQGWNEGDSRQEHWQWERENYGFDERETWSLDYSFKLWLYERLSMYNELDKGVDMNYHRFEYRGEALTLQECIDRILEGLKIDLSLELDLFGDIDRESMSVKNKISDVLPLFQMCLNYLWW